MRWTRLKFTALDVVSAWPAYIPLSVVDVEFSEMTWGVDAFGLRGVAVSGATSRLLLGCVNGGKIGRTRVGGANFVGPR